MTPPPTVLRLSMLFATMPTTTRSPAITSVHNAIAKGWVEDLGFKYLSSRNAEEFDAAIEEFSKADSDKAMFFEVFC